MFEFYKREQGRWTRLATMLGGGLVALLGGIAFATGPMSQIVLWLGITGGMVRVTQIVGGLAFALPVAYLAFWLSYLRPSTGDFFIAVEGEMKKVSWSGRKEVIGSTKVVIFTLAAMGVLLFVVDMAFMLLFDLLGVVHIAGWRELLGLGGGG